MQQVVLFSSDFSKESSDFLKEQLNKAEHLAETQNQLNEDELFNTRFKNPFEKIEADFSEPYQKLQDILERYKGVSLGLPEEWFQLNDRITVNILQKNIRVNSCKPSCLIYMPKNGTPVRLIVNDDFSENQTLSIYFITNANFGDKENYIAFEQSCDEKMVQIQGNINLLNSEFESFSNSHRSEITNKLSAVLQEK